MRKLDLAIIGGGPAGCSAAVLAARRGLGVALLERHAAFHDKVCGELVASEALPTVRGLLEGTPGESALSKGIPIPRAWLHVGFRTFELALQPAAMSLARRELDGALWAAAAHHGAECVERTDVLAVRGDGPFQIETTNGSITARAVVNASGRWSRLGGQAVSRSDWLGLKAVLREERPDPDVHLYFFPGGYCGAQAVDTGLVNVAAAVRRGVAVRLEEVFARNPLLSARSRGWSLASRPLATAPLAFGQRAAPTQGRWVQIGDAAGFIDPFLGHGIATAVASACLAVETLAPALSGTETLDSALVAWRKRYERATRRAYTVASAVRGLLALPESMQALIALALDSSGLGGPLFTRARRVAAVAD